MPTRPMTARRGGNCWPGWCFADGIMRRAWWGTAHAPDPALRARNRGLSRVRYRGLARNALQLQLMCIALNLRRALRLHPV
jgi:IS5 family transposase